MTSTPKGVKRELKYLLLTLILLCIPFVIGEFLTALDLVSPANDYLLLYVYPSVFLFIILFPALKAVKKKNAMSQKEK